MVLRFVRLCFFQYVKCFGLYFLAVSYASMSNKNLLRPLKYENTKAKFMPYIHPEQILKPWSG